VPPDSQDEALVFEWIEGGNVRAGQYAVHRVWLVSENQAPVPAIHVTQGGLPVRWIQPDEGMVSVSGQVSDVNAADTHSLDWSASDERLLLGQTPGAAWQFDPSSLQTGEYRLVLVATDDGAPPMSSRTETLLRVVSNLPALRIRMVMVSMTARRAMMMATKTASPISSTPMKPGIFSLPMNCSPSVACRRCRDCASNWDRPPSGWVEPLLA